MEMDAIKHVFNDRTYSNENYVKPNWIQMVNQCTHSREKKTNPSLTFCFSILSDFLARDRNKCVTKK